MALQNRFSCKNCLFQGISTFIFYKIVKFWPISYQLGDSQSVKTTQKGGLEDMMPVKKLKAENVT